MGRGTHRATGAQRQPRHQQRQSTRVPAPTAVKTMEAYAVGLRAAGTGRTRVGSAGQTPMATLYIPGGSRLGGDRSKRAGGGGRDDAIGEVSSPRSALPPTPSWEESGRGPALPVTLGAYGTRQYQSKINEGAARGSRLRTPPRRKREGRGAGTSGCQPRMFLAETKRWRGGGTRGGVRVGHGFQESFPRFGGGGGDRTYDDAVGRAPPLPRKFVLPVDPRHLLVLSPRTPG